MTPKVPLEFGTYRYERHMDRKVIQEGTFEGWIWLYHIRGFTSDGWEREKQAISDEIATGKSADIAFFDPPGTARN